MPTLFMLENFLTLTLAAALAGFAVWWTESNWGLLGLLLLLNMNFVKARSPHPENAHTATSAGPQTPPLKSASE